MIIKPTFSKLLYIGTFLLCSISVFAQSDSTAKADTVQTGLAPDEKEAYFRGGDKAWIAFISEHLKMKNVNKKAPPGKHSVLIQFVVNTDGSISDIEPMTTIGFGMEEEAIRVIKKSPAWVPAVQGEKKVRAYRRQPITFFIQGK